MFAEVQSPKPEHDATASFFTPILAYLTTNVQHQVKVEVKKMMEEIEDHEMDLRRHTEAHLYEEVEDGRLVMHAEKEECLIEAGLTLDNLKQEFNDFTDATVKKCSEDIQEVAEEKFLIVDAQLNDVTDATMKKFGKDIQEMADKKLLNVDAQLNELVEEKGPSRDKSGAKMPGAGSNGFRWRATSLPL